ncbi:MAG: helix-turn-helix domain-containing protein [Lachnospiraceae bacterium]|nr:helix-turn-helix domain-containing protein [Lachnospiraceae bacterium]
MYRVMLADDEGIVTDSLKMIIEQSYAGECETEAAHTGRSVIELAERFRPDVAIMDIQMPGINGIDAMKEIRRTNPDIIFIVMSAYDKFDYAREAINLGVLDYLNKPFNRGMITTVLDKAFALVDEEREKRERSLMIREKMETVVPVIENGFIYSVMFQENWQEASAGYRELLQLECDHGYMMAIETGDERQGKVLTNTVGTGIRLQSFYPKIREVVKEFIDCYVGALMANMIVCFVPTKKASVDLNEREAILEKTRHLSRRLSEITKAQFRIGVGSVHPLSEAMLSYREAKDSLVRSSQTVAHVEDLPASGCRYDDDYPIETERSLFAAVEAGRVNDTHNEAERFFSWMRESFPEHPEDVRLKCLEFVLWAERLAYLSGLNYHFTSRTAYLGAVKDAGCGELERWFVEHVDEASRSIALLKEGKSVSLVSSVKSRLEEGYMSQDISLEALSREANVSSYYLSRLFREETGETFMEYLTNLRLNKAKELLEGTEQSMKELCQAVGYADPNYFSRIFKKNTGLTPTEYREEVRQG